MKTWIRALSWYTIVIGFVGVFASFFLVGKTIVYSAGHVALDFLFEIPEMALAILCLVFLRGGSRP